VEHEVAARFWPVEIRLDRAAAKLDIDFDDGSHFSLPAELLRVESPSAEVQGHGPHQKTIVPGCRTIGIVAIEPVGHYAIRIRFDDGHDTGIYSWQYLYELGHNAEAIWDAYIANLAEQGLSREPPHKH
jgi:DUF971 family protein